MFAVTLAIEMLLMTAIGMWIQKSGMTGEGFIRSLTAVVMNIALPCLVFKSMTGVEASLEQLKNCGVAFLFALLTCAVQYAVGQGAYCLMGRTGPARIMRYGVIFSHFSFMGIPVMEALFGAEGLLYYSVFLIPVRALYYGATKSLLTPPDGRPEGGSFRELLTGIVKNPCLIAVTSGLAYYVLFGLLLPDFTWYSIMPRVPAVILTGACQCVNWVIVKLSPLCTPLGLIICGMSLGRADFKRLLNIRYLILPAVRCIVMPLLFLGLVTLMGRFAALDGIVVTMVVVFSSLPVASLTATYTIEYDPVEDDQLLASGAVFFSTLLSIVTVPVWYTVLAHMNG